MNELCGYLLNECSWQHLRNVGTLMPFKSLHIAVKKSSKTLEVKKVQRDITVVVNSKYTKYNKE